MNWPLFHHNQIKLSQITKVMFLPDLLSWKWVFLQMTFIWLYKTQLYQLKYLCKAKWLGRHILVCNLLSYQFEGESSHFCIKESQNVLYAIHHMAKVQIWGVSATNGPWLTLETMFSGSSEQVVWFVSTANLTVLRLTKGICVNEFGFSSNFSSLLS